VTAEQSAPSDRLVGFGPTVQLRHIHPFGCTEYPLSCPMNGPDFQDRQARTDGYARGCHRALPTRWQPGSLSRDWGHSSMADISVEVGRGSFWHTHLFADSLLKQEEFLVGNGTKEGFQQDDGLAEACV